MKFKRSSTLIGLFALVAMTAIALLPSPAQAQDQTTSIGLQLVAEGLTAPVDMAVPRDGSGRLFVVDQVGVIHIIGSDGSMMDQPFLDISDKLVEINPDYDERGLLGLAFHPDYANNGRFFVYYSAPLRESGPQEWTNTNVLAEYSVSQDDPNKADPGSEKILFQVDEPQTNHNGGDIAFGPDGYLYVPLGDGGGANDEGMGHTDGMGNGQDLSKHLGKILRIDVDNGDPYGIPEDNPFLNDDTAQPEIWAWGFRNPWRMSFDAGGDHQLFVGMAGQNLWEPIYIVNGGNNYGWRILEGSHCFSVDHPDYSPRNCDRTGANGEALHMPIIEYSHLVGEVVIGGYVYRGSALPSDLQGKYFFGEWSPGPDAGYPSGFGGDGRGIVFTASPPPDSVDNTSAMWKPQWMTIASDNGSSRDVGAFILSFGQDANNELYLLTSNTLGPSGTTGKVWKIVPASGDGM